MKIFVFLLFSCFALTAVSSFPPVSPIHQVRKQPPLQMSTATTEGASKSTLVVTGHGVASFDDWLKVFSGVCQSKGADNFHKEVLKVQFHLGGKQVNPKQSTENDCCVVLGISDPSSDEIMSQNLKYQGEPFDTFIKDGTMIPPFQPNVMGKIVLDRWDLPEQKVNLRKSPEDYMIYVAQHGVPSFDKWYTEAFGGGAPLPAEMRESLGIVRTLAAKGPSRKTTEDDGKEVDQETCIVVHLFEKKCHAAFVQLAKYDAPPFVGGPDFIGQGLVIPPFDINLFCDAAYSIKYEY